MRRDIFLAIVAAAIAHGALFVAVRGLPHVERLREFVRVRIVAVDPQAPVVTDDTREKHVERADVVEVQPAVRKPPALVRNAQAAESASAVSSPQSVVPETAAEDPQTADEAPQPVAQPVAPPVARPADTSSTNAEPAPDDSPKRSQPPAVAGKALATLCPTLRLPGALLGQGFFPRRYLVRLEMRNAPNEEYSIASFESEGDPLAFVDKKIESLVGAECRFLPATLATVLGHTFGEQGGSIVLAIAEGR